MDEVAASRSDAGPSVTAALLTSCRPKQWIKNLLVAAAPAAAGELTQLGVAARTLAAFVAFTIAASGTYLINDVRDRLGDASHPTKRDRPVAAGLVPVRLAATIGVIMLMVAPVLAWWLATAGLAVVVSVYVALQFAYSGGLKRIPLVDLAIVGSGFVLRAVGGAVAAPVPMSQWFIIVTSFAALYVVASKRAAELQSVPIGLRATTRPALQGYTPDLLREIRFTASSVTIAAYVLWAFENAAIGGAIWFELSILPFVLAIYRYGMAVEKGLGETPEEIMLRDRGLLVFSGLWAVTFAVGVHG